MAKRLFAQRIPLSCAGDGPKGRSRKEQKTIFGEDPMRKSWLAAGLFSACAFAVALPATAQNT
ncbi:hypothetical protein LWS69_12490, partial [Bordetella hinzii]|nr:hypothetical protein [Bordetella hinzii]